MRMMTGLGAMAASGTVMIALIAWLCGRAHAWSRRAGVLLASVVASYCGGVALFLVIGTVDGRESLRLGGSLSVVVFASTACAAIVIARRGLAKGRNDLSVGR